MIKFINLFLIVLSAVFYSCSQTEENTVASEDKKESLDIRGNISNANQATIYLFEYSGEKPLKLDSCIISPEGKFDLSTNSNGYKFYGIGKSFDNVLGLLLEGKESVEVSADMNNLMFGSSISGSTDSELMNRFSKTHKSFFDNMQLLRDSLQKLAYEDESARNSILDKAGAFKEEFDTYKYDFINSNLESPAIYLVASELNDIVKDLDYLKLVEKTLSEKMSGSVYHNAVAQKINQAEQAILAQEQQKKMIEQQQLVMKESGIEIGSTAPDLNFTNPDGKNISLSSLKGKIVLLDFWASWCKPCRMENPNVVRLYNEYKDKGFTVFSFSLDNNIDRWKSAIQQDGLSWPNHVSDLKGWQSAGSALYKVNSIPQTFLIDKDGKIIEIGLRGNQLEQKLKELLG